MQKQHTNPPPHQTLSQSQISHISLSLKPWSKSLKEQRRRRWPRDAQAFKSTQNQEQVRLTFQRSFISLIGNRKTQLVTIRKGSRSDSLQYNQKKNDAMGMKSQFFVQHWFWLIWKKTKKRRASASSTKQLANQKYWTIWITRIRILNYMISSIIHYDGGKMTYNILFCSKIRCPLICAHKVYTQLRITTKVSNLQI